MRRLGEAAAAIRARPGLAAVVALGVTWGLVIHSMGWAQLGHFAQVRALADGTANIDRYHWETNDKGYVDGHFYSVKSPGVAGLSLPLYLAVRAADGEELARDAATNARDTAHPRWEPPDIVPTDNYGYDYELSREIEGQVEWETALVWVLTLLIAVFPAVLLLLGVRWAADLMEPGYGTAAAVTLGLCTIVMTFAAEYFSHVISAALGFGAFLLLMREREGPPSRRLVALAGLMAGLAVTFEFQVGLVGVILFLYALSRTGDRLRRAVAYGAGAVAGALPMLAFNTWAFGNPLKLAYGYAVKEPGLTGHDVLGLNSGGFFGIKGPTLDSAVELLLAGRGLLVLTPIVAMAVVGIVLMRRRGHRAESNVITAVGVAYFLYNAGYWLPMGGGTPGPRFLIPALPFLALGLAFAYRRFPSLTLGLAIPSGVFMLAGALTFPLLGDQGTGTWWEFAAEGQLEHTLLTVIGVSNAWLAAAPVLAAVAVAVRATPRTPIHDLLPAFVAVLAWAAVSLLGPGIAGDEETPLDGGTDAVKLIALGVALSMATLSALALRGRLAHRAGEPVPAPAGEGSEATPAPALGERTR